MTPLRVMCWSLALSAWADIGYLTFSYAFGVVCFAWFGFAVI
jgi:hypothetical protein